MESKALAFLFALRTDAVQGDVMSTPVSMMPQNIVVYFFWQHGCIHCTQMMPIVRELRAKNMGRIMVMELNVESHDRIDDVKIKATPTIAIKKDGVLVQVRQGTMTLAKLESLLDAKPQSEAVPPRKRRRRQTPDEPEGPDDDQEEVEP